jgi:UDP-glucose 4-epimerase
MPSRQQILIAGGAGFIGQNLVRALLGRNPDTQITIVDNDIHLTAATLPTESDRLIWHRCDIRQRDAITTVFDQTRPDVVINLAAYAGVADSIADPQSNFEANVIGHFNLLDLARIYSTGHFVFASTGGAIIGDGRPPLTEDMAPNPLSPYGVSKLVGELYADIYQRCYNFNTCCLRFSNVYGEYSFHKGNLIPMFIKSALMGATAQLFGDGTQERDFIYVGDLVEGICRALERKTSGVIQLATGQRTSANALVALLTKVLPDEHPLNFEYQPARSGEVYQTWCDNTKSVALLGDYVDTTLETGLQHTIDWYGSHYRAGGGA